MRVKFLNIDMYIRKGTVAAVISIVVVLLAVITKIVGSNSSEIVFASASNAIKEVKPIEESIKPIATPKLEEEIKVYVIGSVVNPGIVTVRKGQIIEDAINLAGGLTDAADITSINRVYKLRENVMLYIKSKDEMKKILDAEIEKQWQSSGETGPGAIIVNDSGGTILNKGADLGVPKKININTATENELDILPGIGLETAKTIIEYRTTNGNFKNTADLMKIPGIKDSKYNKIKDLIVTD